jgi:glycosyltransferase involved in cell wall biosynthesis
MPKISIIIPVYNVEMYIPQCLESVVSQTLKDIEIICVLDGGNDISGEICRAYAQNDRRIKIIDLLQNRGALIARKTGVDAAEGEYIMFVDPDDWLEIDACSILYERIKSAGVEILHFGSFVHAESEVLEQRVINVQRFLIPYEGKLTGKKVFEGAFVEEKFRFTIWNKIYSSELCKKAYAGFSIDDYVPKANDLCAFFRLAYFAKSYLGIKNKFYHYRFGAGITGKNKLSLATFQIHCMQSVVSQKCRDFLIEQGALESYRSVYDRLHINLLHECINNWYAHLNQENSIEGFKHILKHWDGTDVAIALAKRWYYQTIMLSDRIYGYDIFPYQPRKIRKVAVYYHRYSMGGVQKVLSMLMPALLEQGYEVLFITDEKPSETDYILPESIERVVISPSYKPEDYPSHAIGLRDALKSFDADLLIYNATSSNNLLFDLIIAKTMGIPVVLYIHEYFGVGFSQFQELPVRKIKTFRFADKAVALSQVQRDYWCAAGINTVYMQNPIDRAAHNVKPSLLNNHDIVWVGRLSKEKRYTDALDILARVVKVIPDARMLFVGSFASDRDEREFHRKVKSNGLHSNVKLCGYISDVFSIYEKCSLFLLTSEFESYCMSLAESKAAGLPCVMYHMPYLEMQRNKRGMIVVGLMDTAAAADAIITIFSDKELMHRLGAEARESIQHLLHFDYGKAWKELINSLETFSVEEIETDKKFSNRITVNTLIDSYLELIKRYQYLKNESTKIASLVGDVHDRNNAQLQEMYIAAQKEIALIKMSASYRIGRFVTWIPRKFIGFIKCINENGLKYTIEYSLDRIKTSITSIWNH